MKTHYSIDPRFKEKLLKLLDWFFCFVWYAFVISLGGFSICAAVFDGIDIDFVTVDDGLVLGVILLSAFAAALADRIDNLMLKRIEKEKDHNDVCVWKREKDVVGISANTSCGRIYFYSPSIYHLKYCPYCGRKLDIEEFKLFMNEDMLDEINRENLDCKDCSCFSCDALCPHSGCRGIENYLDNDLPFYRETSNLCFRSYCPQFLPDLTPEPPDDYSE